MLLKIEGGKQYPSYGLDMFYFFYFTYLYTFGKEMGGLGRVNHYSIYNIQTM